MKNRILNLKQFINEFSNDSYMSIVRDVLLRNKQRIMVEADITDAVFNEILIKMTSIKPQSLQEDNLVNDAIVYSKEIANTIENEEKADELGTTLDSRIPQFQN